MRKTIDTYRKFDTNVFSEEFLDLIIEECSEQVLGISDINNVDVDDILNILYKVFEAIASGGSSGADDLGECALNIAQQYLEGVAFGNDDMVGGVEQLVINKSTLQDALEVKQRRNLLFDGTDDDEGIYRVYFTIRGKELTQ